MAEVVTMPKLGFDMAEGVLVEWVKQVGDAVGEDDVIAVIETDKANVEVTPFKTGILRELLVEAGSIIPVGDPIAIIGNADEEIDLAALGLEKAAPDTRPQASEDVETPPARESADTATKP